MNKVRIGLIGCGTFGSGYVSFSNGATGTFITSTGDAPGVNRLEIVLSKGTIRCENGKLSVYVLDEDERDYCFKADNIYKAPEGHFIEVETDGKNEQHQGVVNAFVSKILGTGELVACGEEGLESVMLINALYLSSWTDQTVHIPFDEDLYLALLDRKAEEAQGVR